MSTDYTSTVGVVLHTHPDQRARAGPQEVREGHQKFMVVNPVWPIGGTATVDPGGPWPISWG
jgi:hypothetical protein